MNSNELLIALGWIAIALLAALGSYVYRRFTRPSSPPRSTPTPPRPPKEESPTTVNWHTGDELLNHFVVEGELGRGGLGVVYRVSSRFMDQYYAVKRARIPGPEHRKSLAEELQTWLTLPLHPHIVRCFFHKTIGEDVVIFTQLANGGSLSDSIRRGELNDLADILDIAIQSAWGLYALHQLGLVHQDVKPSNILLAHKAQAPSQAGVQGRARAMIGDFGISRGLAAADDGVTYKGMTLAYCSPEQGNRQKSNRRLEQPTGQPASPRSSTRLTPATDIWSWGLAVLAMFEGSDPPVLRGQLAGTKLMRMERGKWDGPGHAIPPQIADILARCFERDPADRWSDLAEAADALKAAYGALIEQPYARPQPFPVQPTIPTAVMQSALRPAGSERDEAHDWRDPREFLRRAKLRDPRANSILATSVPENPMARIAAHITTSGEIADLLREFVRSASSSNDTLSPPNLPDKLDIAVLLCALDRNTALLCAASGDWQGASQHSDRAIEGLSRLLDEEQIREQARDFVLVDELASVYADKAAILMRQNLPWHAAEQYDRAIAHREKLGRPNESLAWLYGQRAVTHSTRGDHPAGLVDLTRALDEYQALGTDTPEIRRRVAGHFVDQATIVFELGDARLALRIFRQAIDLLESITEHPDLAGVKNQLARALVNMATALVAMDKIAEARTLYDRSIAIREDLAGSGAETSVELANAYNSRADIAVKLGELDDALELFQRGIERLDRAIRDQGRTELLADWAWATLRRAQMLRQRGQRNEAIRQTKLALRLLEEAVERTGHAEYHRLLAWGQRQLA